MGARSAPSPPSLASPVLPFPILHPSCLLGLCRYGDAHRRVQASRAALWQEAAPHAAGKPFSASSSKQGLSIGLDCKWVFGGSFVL